MFKKPLKCTVSEGEIYGVCHISIKLFPEEGRAAGWGTLGPTEAGGLGGVLAEGLGGGGAGQGGFCAGSQKPAASLRSPSDPVLAKRSPWQPDSKLV